MRNGWLSIFVILCLCVLSFASSAQTNFAVSPTCKVNVDKISAVKTSSIDVVPKTGWVEVKNPDVWTERWPHTMAAFGIILIGIGVVTTVMN